MFVDVLNIDSDDSLSEFLLGVFWRFTFSYFYEFYFVIVFRVSAEETERQFYIKLFMTSVCFCIAIILLDW